MSTTASFPARSPRLTISFAALASLLCLWLPMPGVDQALLAELAPPSPSLTAALHLPLPPAPLLTSSILVSLLIARAARHFSRSRWPRVARAFLPAQLALVAATALGTSMFFEQMSTPYGDLVRDAALARLLHVGAAVSLSALLWWMADRVSETGRAHGTLVVWGLPMAIAALDGVWSQAATLAPADLPLAALVLAAPTLPIAVVGVLVALRPPASWPVRLGGLVELRSWLDAVLATALLATSPGALLVGVESVLFSQPVPSTSIRLLSPVVATIALALVWRAHGRGTERARLAPLVALLAPALALVAVAGGAAEHVMHRGGGHIELTLEARDALAEVDAPVLRARAEALGLDATVTVLDSRHLHVVADGVDDAAAMQRAWLRRGELTVRLADVIAPPEIPAAPIELVRYGDHWSYRGSPDALWMLRERVGELEGASLLWMRADDGDELVAVGDEATLTGAEIRDASVAFDPDSNDPFIAISLDEEGTRRLARVTSEHRGERLAIVVDDEILMAPVIQTAITGGLLRITLGGWAVPPEQQLRDASRIVATLASGPLTADWAPVAGGG